MIKTWSSTQNVIALSSGEAECYGLVKGAAQGLGAKAVYFEVGLELSIEVKTDATFANHLFGRGVGSTTHQKQGKHKVVTRFVTAEQMIS